MGTTKSEANKDLDTLRMAYESALQQSNQNGQTVWEIHNIMLLVNTILIGSFGFSSATNISEKIFSTVVSIVGIGLVLVWSFLTKRARKYAEYYLLSAREIEEKYFSDQFDLLCRGGLFAKGESISYKAKNRTQVINMGNWAKYGRVEITSSILNVLFALIYIARVFVIWLS